MSHSKSSITSICASLLLLVAFISTAVSHEALQPNQCASYKNLPCGLCGDAINVTIIARNAYVQPKFEIKVQIIKKSQQPLINFLQEAAEQNGLFNFTSSYNGKLGFMVNTINKVAANVTAKTYWNIKSVTHRYSSLQCGVSTYVPLQDETILFNFTTWG